jgi:hypothetical protein
MNAQHLRALLSEAGIDCTAGPDDHSFWVRVEASQHRIRFAVVVHPHRCELLFRFGHAGEMDRATVLDLLYLNHETTHFRVGLNDRMDLLLFGTWPPAELDPEIAVWLVEEFALWCENIQADVADLVH